MAQSTPATRSALFKRVYQEAQRVVGGLLTPLLRTLDELGCGPGGSLEVFEPKARQVIAGFAHDPAGAAQFMSLRVSVTPAVREGLIASFLFSLGVPKEAAEAGAKTIIGIPREQMLQTGRTWGNRPTPEAVNAPAARLFIGLRAAHRRARDLHKRLTELRATVNEPYRGDRPANARLTGRNNTPGGRRAQAARYADRGVEQTVELLQMFPDLADGVYQRAGLRGLAGFPPRSTEGALQGDTAEFVNHVEEHLSDESMWGIVSVVALIAAGVVLTVVTAGVAGPLVGMAAGAAVGLAQGGVHVASASNDFALARDGHRIGAVSEERLAFLEGEVQGAWGMLMVDVASGGLLGRFGGAGNVGKVAQAFRTMAISGAGTGVGTATNPNVWDAPDVAAILLKATVVGAVAGGAGAAAGGALTRVGNRLMVGLSRGSGPLQPGAPVTLSTKGGASETLVRGEVVAVEGSRVRVATPRGEVALNVDDAAIVRTADGSAAPATPTRARPPGRVRDGAGVADWVREDARATLQRAVDLGPNSWAAMPKRPQGQRFQRGYSGDYASGRGGLQESSNLLAGQVESTPRTVSIIGGEVRPGRGTHEVTAVYSDPLSIRGRSGRVDPSRGRDPDREGLIDELSLNDVEALGFFPNMSTPWVWAQNYLRLVKQATITPTSGSRGAKFHEDLDGVLSGAAWQADDFGRRLTNESEMNSRLGDLFLRYGSRTESSGFASTRYSD